MWTTSLGHEVGDLPVWVRWASGGLQAEAGGGRFKGSDDGVDLSGMGRASFRMPRPGDACVWLLVPLSGGALCGAATWPMVLRVGSEVSATPSDPLQLAGYYPNNLVPSAQAIFGSRRELLAGVRSRTDGRCTVCALPAPAYRIRPDRALATDLVTQREHSSPGRRIHANNERNRSPATTALSHSQPWPVPSHRYGASPRG